MTPETWIYHLYASTGRDSNRVLVLVRKTPKNSETVQKMSYVKGKHPIYHKTQPHKISGDRPGIYKKIRT